MNTLLVFLTIAWCVTPLFAQQNPCSSVNAIPISSGVIAPGDMVLYKISTSSSAVKITSDFTPCAPYYIEGVCKAVHSTITKVFARSCSSAKNGVFVQKNLRRFVLQSWGEDNKGNLLLVQQEFESTDDNREFYKVRKVVVRKAQVNNLFAANMVRPQDIINLHLNNIIGIVGASQNFMALQICNTSTSTNPLVIIFTSKGIYNQSTAPNIINEVNQFIQNSGFGNVQFITLPNPIDVDPALIQNVPDMPIDQTPPTC